MPRSTWPTHADRGFALDPAAVEAAITSRTKVLFLGYPCNPTGAVLDEATLLALADIAERHDLLVVSDEIYDRLVYGDHRHRAFSSLPGARDRTVLIGGFSKAYAMTGWRVGWLAAPRDLLEGIVKVHQYEIMSAPTTAQDAAVVALTGAEPDVQRMVAEYDRRRQRLVAGFNALGLPTFEPRGAFYAFPDITSSGLTSAAVQRAAAVRAAGRGHPRRRLRAVRRGPRAGLLRHQLRAAGDGPRAHRPVPGQPARVTGRYEAVIGIEIHVQLRTSAKMFCPCGTDIADAAPNSRTCPVCLGMPGTLPVINRRAVEHVLATGMAIGGEVPEVTRWDRKNYFYPDLPKGYQISQFDLPLASHGRLAVETSAGEVVVGIRRAHLEEDTARLIHAEAPDGRRISLVDFNRAGMPLMEIVTEPDLHTAEAARRYAEELRLLLLAIGASEAAMESGQMRVEANVSLRPVGSEAPGDAHRGQEHELVPLRGTGHRP